MFGRLMSIDAYDMLHCASAAYRWDPLLHFSCGRQGGRLAPTHFVCTGALFLPRPVTPRTHTERSGFTAHRGTGQEKRVKQCGIDKEKRDSFSLWTEYIGLDLDWPFQTHCSLPLSATFRWPVNRDNRVFADDDVLSLRLSLSISLLRSRAHVILYLRG